MHGAVSHSREFSSPNVMGSWGWEALLSHHYLEIIFVNILSTFHSFFYIYIFLSNNKKCALWNYAILWLLWGENVWNIYLSSHKLLFATLFLVDDRISYHNVINPYCWTFRLLPVFLSKQHHGENPGSCTCGHTLIIPFGEIRLVTE